MRHSRRNVMAEKYKLYIRKNIINGRYFVRNMQVGLCIILALAVLIASITLIKASDTKSSNKNVTKISDGVNVKEALFGSTETIKKDVASVDTESTDISVTGDIDTISDASVESAAKENASKADESDVVESGINESKAVDSEVIDPESSDSQIIDTNVQETDNTIAGITEAVEAFSQSGAAVVADVSDNKDSEEEPKGEFDDRCIANVDETLNVRKEPSRDAEFVGSMEKGSIAKVLEREGEWTKIKSGDVEGYVLSEYILTGKIAEEFSKDYVTIQGTATEDGVNVREDRSTDADILTVLDKDDTVSVVEIPDNKNSENNENSENTEDTVDNEAVNTEAENDEDDKKSEDSSEDITWYTVMLEDGQIGYVSADYVDVDKLYTLAVSAEELIRREEERAAAERAAAEAAMLAAQETAAAASASGSTSSSSSNNSSSYQGATTTPVTAAESGECLGTFTITAYCGCSKCSGGHNKTASGTTPTQGRTIAADTSILPFGTQVVIGGIVYTVEDRGSGVSGNHIDIFFATHEDALAFGSKSMKVYKY